MDQQARAQLGSLVLKAQAATYGVEIPDRIKTLWESGEIFKYDGLVLENAELPGRVPGSTRFRVTVPCWLVHGGNGAFDDAIVGPRGEWKKAGVFVPLLANADGVIVVRVDNPELPIGWFVEESWRSKAAGFTDGVFMLAPSLDVFLKQLTPAETVKWDDEGQMGEMLWMIAAEAGGGD